MRKKVRKKNSTTIEKAPNTTNDRNVCSKDTVISFDYLFCTEFGHKKTEKA